MGFLDDEQGVETSRGREGIEIITGSGLIPTVHRIATGTRNITINGQRYDASPAARGEVTMSMAANGTDLEIVLPLAHAIPQRYMQGGVPPRSIQVTVWRQQLNGGESEVIWRGLVTSLAIQGHTAKMLVPARLTRVLRRIVPTITAGKLCPHILYNLNCRVDRDAFKVIGTVGSVNGRRIRVNVAVEPDTEWAKYGEFLHAPTGERVTIMETDEGTDLDGPHMFVEVQIPIDGVTAGDSVTVYAGCPHTISACRSKFANVVNFGGFPHAQGVNFFKVEGAGFYV